MTEVPLPVTDTQSNNVDIVGQTLNSLSIQESAPLDVSGATVTITDDGTLTIANLPEPVDVDTGKVTVTDDGTLAINSLPEPLDVSGATVTVRDDGNLSIASLPEPLDVSGATVSVTDDGALSVASVESNVTVEQQLASTGSYGSISVGTTATEVIPANTGRQSFIVQNLSADTSAFIGFDSNLTDLNGLEIPPNGTYGDDTYTGSVYIVSEAGTVDIRHQEVSK